MDTSHLFEDYERAISYNIINTHKTLQQIENECEQKMTLERQRYKDKEQSNKQKIKQLTNQLLKEQSEKIEQLNMCTDIKRRNLEMRKKMSELIQDNNMLAQSNNKLVSQVQTQEKIITSQQQSIQQYQLQIVALQQKMAKKIEKREGQLDELEETLETVERKYQQEIQDLQQYKQQLEFELFSYKKDQLNLEDKPNYEDRVKQLIQDLENMAKNHVQEISQVHHYYRDIISKCEDLESKVKIYQQDYQQAVESERNYRKENVRLHMILEEFQKQRGRRRTVDPNKENQNQISNQRAEKKPSPPKQNQRKERPQTAHPNQRRKPSKQTQQKEESVDITEQESAQLAQIVENIENSKALANGNVRRIFSLQNFLMNDKEVLPKKQMIKKLAEYDNLIRAMGALFYISKRMQDIVPCVFQAWKENIFEKKAKKIRNLLSESEANMLKSMNKKGGQEKDSKGGTGKLINELGNNGKTINYDDESSNQVDEDMDEDFQSNYEEEFIKVQDSEQSCSILPYNNVRKHARNSQYEDDEEDISMEEEEDDEEKARLEEEEKKKKKWEFKESDPEVQNAKLLEKYAQMSGGQAQQEQDDEKENEESGVIYLDENGQEIDPETLMMMMGKDGIIQGEDGVYYQICEDEDMGIGDETRNEFQNIVTADYYIDDDEEQRARAVQGKNVKDRIIHQPSTSYEGSGSKGKKKKNRYKDELDYYEEDDGHGNVYLVQKKR